MHCSVRPSFHLTQFRSIAVGTLAMLLISQSAGQANQFQPLQSRRPVISVAQQVETLFEQALEKANQGDFQGSVDGFTEVLRQDPQNADAYYNRGLIRGRYLEDLEGALADLNQTLRLKPNQADAYNNRGIVKRSMGNNQAAIADYTQSIKVDPRNALAYYNRGRAYTSLGEKRKAIADFQSAARLFQQSGDQTYYQQSIRELQKLK